MMLARRTLVAKPHSDLRNDLIASDAQYGHSLGTRLNYNAWESSETVVISIHRSKQLIAADVTPTVSSSKMASRSKSALIIQIVSSARKAECNQTKFLIRVETNKLLSLYFRS